MLYMHLRVALAVILLGIIAQGRTQIPDSFRIRKIAVEGASQFTADQIIAISGLRSDSIAAPGIFETAKTRILRAYSNRGCIQAHATVTSKPGTSADDDMKPADIVVRIDEGPVFSLRRLEFLGNKTTRDYIIRRWMLLNEGEPYGEDLLELSLERLNRLRRFEPLSKKDVRMETHRDEKFVDLRLYVKEIRKR